MGHKAYISPTAWNKYKRIRRIKPLKYTSFSKTNTPRMIWKNQVRINKKYFAHPKSDSP